MDVMEALQRHDDSQSGLMEKFVSVCWGIWKERNVVRIGGLGKLGRTTLKHAFGLMEEYQLANQGLTKLEAVSQEPVKWKTPRQGQYKVNIDGAVNSKEAGSVRALSHTQKGREISLPIC